MFQLFVLGIENIFFGVAVDTGSVKNIFNKVFTLGNN